ncbi:MAG: tRNA (adenosine(37)-N6)-dimethylallyltransferase MiaA [Peptococcaceae bacterium]|jgi:tRNA dimethylallyltransferase|nr:tRNA (adenosine(37)-N6)-dimethylallyltransferase MiaA [Peptococcaceae bacterium]
MTPLLVVVGPTATGKTALAVELAQRLDGEVISADSMQVYRYMDIGTAKPTVEERQGIPHHLIDVVDPDQEFNAALYGELARRAVREAAARGRWPILAGGTGLYIRSVTDPCSFGAITGDQGLRSQLEEDAAGGEDLHRRLTAVDPVTAARLHPNDLRRVIRALEVYLLTGTPLSQYQRRDRSREGEFRPLAFGLTADRPALYRRIGERVDRMLAGGLLAEVEGLRQRGYGRRLTAMQGLGYKELAGFLAGETDYESAVEMVKRGTRRLAKRQWTWFGRDKSIRWFTAEGKMQGVAEEIAGQLAGVPGPGVEKMGR